MPDPMLAIIQRAVRGDPVAMQALLAEITPTIRFSVGDTLRRRTRSAARSRARHEIEDLTQDVLVAFLSRDGRRLLQWDPDRGLSLRRYVELVTRHLVESFLRKRDRRVWENEHLDTGASDHLEDRAESPEGLVERKQLFAAVRALVEAELTRQGREVFHLLVVNGLTVPEVCAQTGMTPNAVHVWRSRLAARVRDALARIQRGAFADD